MKTRPKALKIMALILTSIALAFPLQVVLLFGDSPFDPLAIALKLTPLNWIVLILALAAARAVYDATPSSKALLPAFLFFLSWNNWIVAATELNYSFAIVVFSTALVFLIHTALLFTDAKTPLTDPKARWWLTARRTKTSICVHYASSRLKNVRLRTFDLSESGAFIAVQAPDGISVRNFQEGTNCSVRLNLDTEVLQCKATIVRSSSATGHYPSGFGIQFSSLGFRQKRALKSYLQRVSDELSPHAFDRATI